MFTKLLIDKKKKNLKGKKIARKPKCSKNFNPISIEVKGQMTSSTVDEELLMCALDCESSWHFMLMLHISVLSDKFLFSRENLQFALVESSSQAVS